MFIPENDWIFVVDNENNKIEAKEREEEEEGNLIEKEVVAVNKLEEEINKIIEEEKNLNKKPEKQLLSISTQTDYYQQPQQQQNIQQQINNQQQQLNKQIKIIQDWGETNFNINRWICHNAMLYKIFNRR
uniref:Uncharacterized protein n=1 Tax=Meloidogyne enterolobii TaxID=390850 RepID=A0A6V7WJB0_MELEN|nr:unnamed protein product [Meloidogyne enterolobii]